VGVRLGENMPSASEVGAGALFGLTAVANGMYFVVGDANELELLH
jgi:hypothetical protein